MFIESSMFVFIVLKPIHAQSFPFILWGDHLISTLLNPLMLVVAQSFPTIFSICLCDHAFIFWKIFNVDIGSEPNNTTFL